LGIYELTVNQSYYDQLVVNRFHYVSTGSPSGVIPSFALISALGFIPTGSPAVDFPANTLGDAFQGLVSASVIFRSVYARELWAPTDFYEIPYPSGVVGQNSGDQGSPVLAFGFTSSRVRTDIRRGSKRFAGVGETDMSNGGDIVAGTLSMMNNLAGYLGEVVSYTEGGASLSFLPAILGLVEYTTPRGNTAYKHYPTLEAQMEHVATGMTWAAMPQVRTQVSRQYSRGA